MLRENCIFCPSCGANIGSNVPSQTHHAPRSLASNRLETAYILCMAWGAVAIFGGIFLALISDLIVDMVDPQSYEWLGINDLEAYRLQFLLECALIVMSGILSVMVAQLCKKRTNYAIASILCIIASLLALVDIVGIVGFYVVYLIYKSKNAFIDRSTM